jgi:hypothetical protein
VSTTAHDTTRHTRPHDTRPHTGGGVHFAFVDGGPHAVGAGPLLLLLEQPLVFDPLSLLLFLPLPLLLLLLGDDLQQLVVPLRRRQDLVFLLGRRRHL